MSRDLVIDGVRVIPESEIAVSSATSGGPGGQNVNRVQTKIELRWRPAETAMRLTLDERVRMMTALAPRLTRAGDLVVTAESERSQLRNREVAGAKLAAIVRASLVRPKPRKKTRPSRGAQQRRLDAKKRASAKKKERRFRE